MIKRINSLITYHGIQLVMWQNVNVIIQQQNKKKFEKNYDLFIDAKVELDLREKLK